MQHGEGKQWYLQMKNYSDELLHAQLSPEHKLAVQFNTRREWIDHFIKWNIIPASGGKYPINSESDIETSEKSVIRPTEDQILAQNKLEHFGQVIPIEDVEKVLTQASSITRLPCACRYDNRGLINQRYCFGFGVDVYQILGAYPVSSASFEVMGIDEAQKLIHKFDEEGLMHSVWSGVTPYVFGLCNCDGDCGAYQGYIKNRGVPSFFRAEYICQVDLDQCTGCRECMRQCQFGAQFYSSAMGKVTIEPQLCFGCGVCRAACPQDAIRMIPRAQSEVAANIW